MLNNISSEIGYNLANILKSNNIELGCKPSSLLEELTASISNNILTIPASQFLIPEGVANSSLGVTTVKSNVSTYIQSQHDSIMDNYIEDVKTLVSNHVNFARTVVNQEVTSLSECISNKTASYRFKEPEDFFQVSYFKLDPIFTSYIVTSEVMGFSNITHDIDNLNLSKATVDLSFSDYLCINDEETDQFIVNWVSRVGVSLIKHYICTTNDPTRLDIDEMLDYTLANYLFYRNLTIRTDLNLGLNLTNLRLSASKNRDYFAYACKNAITLYGNYIKQNKLLLNKSKINFSYMNDNDIVLKIFDENYANFVEQGGSLEVLFGYVSSNSSTDVTVKYLLDNKDSLYKNWNSVRNMYALYLTNRKLDTYKSIISDCFRESMNELTEAEKDIYINEDLILQVKNAGYKYINDLTIDSIQSVEDVALDLVAKYRFGFSNAYEILLEMKSIMSMDDTITPMEAALLSSVKLVTRFMLDQVVKV